MITMKREVLSWSQLLDTGVPLAYHAGPDGKARWADMEEGGKLSVGAFIAVYIGRSGQSKMSHQYRLLIG